MDDIDFRSKVTRDEFEDMTSDLSARVGRVVEDALKSSEMTMVRQPPTIHDRSRRRRIKVCIAVKSMNMKTVYYFKICLQKKKDV